MSSNKPNNKPPFAQTYTTTELWDALKLLARQMRHEPTPAENVLWELIRNRNVLGFKFRRQHPIDRFIVDFFCAEVHLIIEVDGSIHDYTKDEDALRTAFLESRGLRVLRFRNEDVLEHIADVHEKIERALNSPPILTP
jgi:very-short-patch-repair endonuclease